GVGVPGVLLALHEGHPAKEPERSARFGRIGGNALGKGAPRRAEPGEGRRRGDARRAGHYLSAIDSHFVSSIVRDGTRFPGPVRSSVILPVVPMRPPDAAETAVQLVNRAPVPASKRCAAFRSIDTFRISPGRRMTRSRNTQVNCVWP